MLLWLEGYLGDDMGSTTVVLISDGYPAAYCTRCNEVEHTRQLAHEFAAKGMRYISVLVKQSYNDLYPSEATAVINSDNYDSLIEAFQQLDARGF